MVSILNISNYTFGNIFVFFNMKEHIKYGKVCIRFYNISKYFLPNITCNDYIYFKHFNIKNTIIINPKNIFNWFIKAIKHHEENTAINIYNIYKEAFNPSTFDNTAIIAAAMNGHTNIVKLLMKDKRVDFRCDNNTPLESAKLYEHDEIIKLLSA